MKISSMQLFWTVSTFEFGMTLLLTQSPSIEAAKQDAWISFAISGLGAIGIVFVTGKLSLLYPNQTLIEYSQTILGKWLGKLIVVPYFIQFFLVLAVILRQSTEFIRMTLFRNTPLVVLIICIVYLMVYVTYKGGIEGIGRCSEVIGPIIFVGTIIIMLLSMNDIEWKQILPIYMDSGWKSILTGSISPLSFLGEASIIMMLISFSQEPKKGVIHVVGAVGMVSLFITMITIEVIMVFGVSLSNRLWYPYFEMVRFISIMEFVQNIEIMVAVIWVLSIFIKLSTYLFITSYGIAQYFHIKDWRKMIWVTAIIIIPLSLFFKNIDVSSIEFPQKFWVPYILPINMIGIPLFLWIVGSIRIKRSENQRMI